MSKEANPSKNSKNDKKVSFKDSMSVRTYDKNKSSSNVRADGEISLVSDKNISSMTSKVEDKYENSKCTYDSTAPVPHT